MIRSDSPSRARAAPEELVGLLLTLEEREGLAREERRRLDREIGATAGSARGVGLLRVWLAKAPSDTLRARLARLRRSLGLLAWLFFAIGMFLGWAAASALLQVEVHAGRINIVLCLVLLVVLPFGLLLLSVVGLALSLRGGAQTTTLGAWLRRAGLGRLAMGFVAPGIRPDIELLLGRMKAHSRLYARVERGLLMGWAQRVGLGFAGGALMATLAFVVFTDLAFGWSTTLDVAGDGVHRGLAWLARPWAALWPEASPSLELVETTRFFRVEAERHIHVVDPIVYGGWWPFLVMAIGVYGMLPRALAIFAVDRWRAGQTAEAMLLTPGVDRLFDRLTTPLVETRADAVEGEIGRAESGLVPEVEPRPWLARETTQPLLLVRWAELADPTRLAAALGLERPKLLEAGGRRSLSEDAEVVRACGEQSGGLLLAVRAYEPPLLEQLDFLDDCRRAMGPARPICVLLVGGAARDREAWRHKLVGLGDPALAVAALAELPS